MITRLNTKNNQSISQLSFGCMRFPKSYDDTKALILHAIENGITHYDTAWIYPNSEVTLGRILAELGMRDRVTIATKLPLHKVKKEEDLDKIFYEQLKRLQTTWVDYYFMHCITHVNTWKRLKKLGIIEWIEAKKASGEIRNIGFSFHGASYDFAPIVDSYDWEFGMIQLNYVDENFQAGRAGLEYLAEKQIPIMIMEPLRGGELVKKLHPKAKELFAKAKPEWSPAEWAFRWVFDLPQVMTVLSGMSDMAMLEENLRVASEAQAGGLTADELAVYEQAKRIFSQAVKVACTGCAYCMPCPVGVDIPAALSCYNDIGVAGWRPAFKKYLMTTSAKHPRSNAGKCIKCGACSKKCPQNIDIVAELKMAKKKLEPFFYKPVAWGAKRMLKIDKS